MRQINVKYRLRGMTLIEVIIAMVIIVLVTTIAYMGVSTSAGLVQRGTDIRNADGLAPAAMEEQVKNYLENGSAEHEKKIIKGEFRLDTVVTDAEGNRSVETGVAYEVTKEAKLITVTEVYDEDNGKYIEYDMVLPFKAKTE